MADEEREDEAQRALRERAERARKERAERAARASAARALVKVRERTGKPIPDEVRRWAAEADDF